MEEYAHCQEFYIAGFQGNLTKLNSLISEVQENPFYWSQCLSGACQGGHLEIVSFAISKGARISQSDLFIACAGGHLQVARFIFEFLKSKDIDLCSALGYACESGNAEIVRFISKNERSLDYINLYYEWPRNLLLLQYQFRKRI